LIEKALKPLLRLIFTAIVLGIGLNLYSVIWAWVLAIVISFFLSVHLLQKRFKNIPKYPAKISKKEIFTYSLPLWFSISINKKQSKNWHRVNRRFFNFWAGRNIWYRFSYDAILAPMISALFKKNEIDNLEKIHKSGSRWVITSTLPAFALMVVFSKQICSIFGSEFYASAEVMVILYTAQMINISTGSSHNVLTMTGKSVYVLVNSIFYFLSNIVLTVVLLKQFGLVGAAFGFGI
jgi:O-antigen/teichoic acid export membrane protein